MRINRVIAAVAIAGLVVLTTNAFALEPAINLPKSVYPTGVIPDAGIPSGPQTQSDACPAASVGTLASGGGSWTGSTIGSTDDFDASTLGCGDNPGGRDEIFEFAVDGNGLWSFDTCTVPACWDTTLSIREETGGGCPGDFVACDGDGCNVCVFESGLLQFLTAGTTYYLIVDGWSTYTYGDFEVTYINTGVCTTDADCDDGELCNGLEACLASGECVAGPPACALHQICDPVTNECTEPDPCTTWEGGVGSDFFFPQINLCPDIAAWVFDDIQTSKHGTDILDFYTTPVLARSIDTPIGTTFLVNQAIWTVEAGSCAPLAIVAGTTCTGVATTDAGGSPAHDLPCSGTMPLLPNNDGDFSRCETDFFIAFRTSNNGAGMWIAGGQQTIGGPALRDDFGVDVIFIEDCPPTGVFGATFFGDDENLPADFATAVVCQKLEVQCCVGGTCTIGTEDECATAGGTVVCTSTITDGHCVCEGDGDGDGIDGDCGDNCPNDNNPGQEDCDGDGEGDACEADSADQDRDDDGHCNGVDNCEFVANPGQEDRDGDLVGDVCDPCPDANPDDADNDGVCDDVDICLGHDDNADADGDGVPDGCDVCPGSDDNAPGAQGDDDGDGVINCLDQCNGVDDGVFAPECDGRIPTVSEWGLVVLALLLLVAGKVYFGRRESLA